MSYGRELLNYAKIYTNDAKYNGRNDSFICKLAISHDIYSKANINIPLEVKIKIFLTMLRDLALDNYFSNISIGGHYEFQSDPLFH